MPIGINKVSRNSQIGSDIPDSGDLHAHYDATQLALSDGNAVNTWADESGNGYDLTAGSAPTFQTNAINGNPVVRFDGVDDYLDVVFSTLSQPNQIFAVFQFIGGLSSNTVVYSGESSQQIFGSQHSGEYRIRAGITSIGGSTDTNPHVSNLLFDNSNPHIRIDGTSLTLNDQDIGNEGLDGFTVGSSEVQVEFADVRVGEILVYPQDKTGIQSDAESYLADKWGITL